MENEIWRKCTTCKKPIAFNANYLVCSVSTCNTKRAAMAFCDIQCWDVHLPVMNHREAFWEQKKAPKSLADAQKQEMEKKSKPKVQAIEVQKESKNNIIIRKKSF